MNTILFLDDMEARHSAFRDYAAEYGYAVDSAYTAEQAIAKLEAHEYMAAALDHDLAEEHYAMPYESGTGTAHSGRAVARWIAQHGKPPKVWVHSFNPDGSAAMLSTLIANPELAVLRMPFGPTAGRLWLKFLSEVQ